MVIPDVKKQILTDLERLTPDMQRKAALLIRGLNPNVRQGTPGRKLMRFAGVIDPTSAQEMSKAIEANREQEHEIDENFLD